MTIIQSSPRAVSGSEPGRATNGQTVRVAVLVNLFRNETSGGHVKCWEHFANAAIREKSIAMRRTSQLRRWLLLTDIPIGSGIF